MNARLERKLRYLAAIIAVGTIVGIAVNLAQGRTSPSSIVVGAAYGLQMCIAIGGLELFVLDGALRTRLGAICRLRKICSCAARSMLRSSR